LIKFQFFKELREKGNKTEVEEKLIAGNYQTKATIAYLLENFDDLFLDPKK